MNANTEIAHGYLLLATKCLERGESGEALMWIDEAQDLLLRETAREAVEIELRLEKRNEPTTRAA